MDPSGFVRSFKKRMFMAPLVVKTAMEGLLILLTTHKCNYLLCLMRKLCITVITFNVKIIYLSEAISINFLVCLLLSVRLLLC